MNFLLLALLVNVGVVASVLLVLLAPVAVRALRGERWEVPLTWSPELKGILPAPGEPSAPAVVPVAARPAAFVPSVTQAGVTPTASV